MPFNWRNSGDDNLQLLGLIMYLIFIPDMVPECENILTEKNSAQCYVNVPTIYQRRDHCNRLFTDKLLTGY